MHKVRIIITAVILGVFSCKTNKIPFDAAGLTYRNKFVFAGQLKMDGFFYREGKNGLHVEYFFEDGYSARNTTVPVLKTECVLIDNKLRKIPSHWGVYDIKNGIIKVQWIAAHGADKYGKLKVEERWARIEGEGQILHYYLKKNIDGQLVTIDEIYRFHPCASKPVSKNILMEQ